MMFQATLSGLPDPEYQAEFYDDIPAKRAIAWVVDTLIVAAATLAVVVLTVGIGIFFIGLVWAFGNFIYRVVTLANGSATLGMRLMSIEIRRADGQRLDLATAFIHTLAFALSMSFVLPQLISIVLMLTTDRRQGLTDMVLGTAAINRSARM